MKNFAFVFLWLGVNSERQDQKGQSLKGDQKNVNMFSFSLIGDAQVRIP